jgi:hypothetical protein
MTMKHERHLFKRSFEVVPTTLSNTMRAERFRQAFRSTFTCEENSHTRLIAKPLSRQGRFFTRAVLCFPTIIPLLSDFSTWGLTQI